MEKNLLHNSLKSVSDPLCQIVYVLRITLQGEEKYSTVYEGCLPLLSVKTWKSWKMRGISLYKAQWSGRVTKPILS